MIQKTILISFSLIILSSYNCFAQNEWSNIGDEIFGFVTKLDKEINTFFGKKKAEKTYRLIGYFREDLDSYLKVRRSFLDSLKTWDYKSQNGNLELISTQLKNSIGKLRTRVSDLIPIIGDDLDDDAENIVREIDGQVAVQQNYLSKLQQLINGNRKSVSKTDIIEEGEAIQKQLTKALKIMGQTRTKLKTKFKL